MGWQTLSINQDPGLGTNYPLAAPSDDVRYLLGDLFLSYTDDGCDVQPPFHIHQLKNFNTNPSARRDMVIADINGVVVFDTTGVASDHYTDRAWGTNLRTLSWIGDTCTLHATYHTAPPPWDPTRTWNTGTWSPASAQLSDRTYSRTAPTVRSIIVGNTSFTEPLELLEGFNIQLTTTSPAATDGGRISQQISIRGRPGDGLGRTQGCDESPILRTINGVSPDDNGNFTLEVGDCHRLQVPATLLSPSPRRLAISPVDLSPGIDTLYGLNLDQLLPYTQEPDRGTLQTVMQASPTLQLTNDCSPCCTCQDFVNTYRALQNVDGSFVTLGKSAEGTRDTLTDVIARWNAQRECRLAKALKLMVQAEPRCSVFIGGLFGNMSGGCILPITLRLTMLYYRDGAPFDISATTDTLCREARRSGTDTNYAEVPFSWQGAWPVLDVGFDVLNVASSSRFRSRFRLNDCLANDVLQVVLTAHANESVDPQTGLPVPLPDPGSIDIPSAVAALWVSNPPPAPVRALLSSSVPVGPVAGCEACE